MLITGCSSGIGHETARHLASKGWSVYATARKPETLADLAEAGCKTLACDVTDEASMRACVDAVIEAEGAVGVLVNNAGYSQSGAVESVDLDSIRRQFETNVFGLIRMSQLALPGMREQGWGRIVNVSSMGGKLTFPGGGIYHATKHAVEAISRRDALGGRRLRRGRGLRRAGTDHHRLRRGGCQLARRGHGGARGRTRSSTARWGRRPQASTPGRCARLGGGPDAVARVIEKAISARRPRTRYKVTPSARLAIAQRRLRHRPRVGPRDGLAVPPPGDPELKKPQDLLKHLSRAAGFRACDGPSHPPAQ